MLGIYKVRHGFHLKYISTILMSRYFKYKTYGEKGLLMSKFADFEIPYLTISDKKYLLRYMTIYLKALALLICVISFIE